MGFDKGPGPIPPRWLKCPRKSDALVGNRFLACKTPLDEKFNDQIPIEFRFSPTMLIHSMRQHKVKIGLWIDLTNTTRFYDKKKIEDEGCRYVKIHCRGHAEAPPKETVETFVQICKRFTEKNPLEIIVVHCTHGFNRSGFLISSYLIEQFDWSVDMAVNEFIKARPPGIYKEDYLKEIYKRYSGDPDEAPPAPELPEWCIEDDNGFDEDGEPLEENGGHNNHQQQRKGKRGGKFMDGVPGVVHFTLTPKLSTLQKKIQAMCEWKKSGFPGCQPISMAKDNLMLLGDRAYKVSW